MLLQSIWGFFQVGDHQKDGFQFQYQAMIIHNLDNFGYPYDFGCSPHIPTATKYRWKMLEKETHQIDNFKSPQNSRTHQFEPSNICCMRPPTLDSTSQNKTDHSPSCAKGRNTVFKWNDRCTCVTTMKSTWPKSNGIITPEVAMLKEQR